LQAASLNGESSGSQNMMTYLDYSSLVDTGLVIALACVVWAAYRELRNRQQRTVSRKEAFLD
jgi:hypothetical protein